MSYAQPDLEWIPANEANFMYGRQGSSVKYITFHHAVGTAQSAVSRFLQPVQVSAHFIVGSGRIICMVDTDDTAFTNGNWAANISSVTIEHEGDWRFGYWNEGVINTSAQLVAWLRSLYPTAQPSRHRDFSATACPGDLPVEEIWDRATKLLNPPAPAPVPAPTPAPTPVQPEWLANRKAYVHTMYVQNGNTQLRNLNDPSKAADTRLFAVNAEINVGAKTTVNGETFYITQYSTDKNIAAGYREADLNLKPYKAPELPPVVIPVPVSDKDKEQDAKINALTALVTKITQFLSSMFKGF